VFTDLLSLPLDNQTYPIIAIVLTSLMLILLF